LNKGFWILAFLLSVSSVFGIVLSNEAIKLLFERGSFNVNDTVVTAQVLSMYLIGLVPFGLAKLFSLWLFAYQEQKRAAKISAISLLINIIFSFLLFKPYGVVGLALAGSIGGWVLLVLTIYAFGIKRFLDIIISLKLALLVAILIIELFVLLYFKDIINVYL
ncbi:MAG: lipid II flippase MurJ, partial [Campylobacteraceae bacterium]